MSLPNYPDSQKDVLTTITHALLAFEDMVRTEMPNCQVVYDEELSYESAIRTLIAKGNFNEQQIKGLPVFIYNRSTLRSNSWGLGQRANNYDGVHRLSDGTYVNYTPMSGEFDINFLYVSKSVKDVEQFEVVYLADEGISNSTEFVVNMGPLGEFKYFALYQELTDKPIVKDDVYYKGMAGTMTMRGYFFTFRAKVSVIQEIREKIIALRSPISSIGTDTEEAEVLVDKIIPE